MLIGETHLPRINKKSVSTSTGAGTAAAVSVLKSDEGKSVERQGKCVE